MIFCCGTVTSKRASNTRRKNVLRRKRRILPRYTHAEVIVKLRERFSLSNRAAHLLFKDLMRFLMVCADSPRTSLVPSVEIDKAWHEFLLYTKDYQEFNQKYLGTFVHHMPARRSDDWKKQFNGFQRTRELVKKLFGTLSRNWQWCSAERSNCSDCEGGSSG